ncbi:hypothetical protein D049_0283A, partial [Vibrio parahaemolyticus VPTS-2010]
MLTFAFITHHIASEFAKLSALSSLLCQGRAIKGLFSQQLLIIVETANFKRAIFNGRLNGATWLGLVFTVTKSTMLGKRFNVSKGF